jgi:hypothetical protein
VSGNIDTAESLEAAKAEFAPVDAPSEPAAEVSNPDAG